MTPRTYWTSPRGILHRARDKANPPMTDITTTKIPPRTCTIGPSAVTGERCGKPAVAWFIGGGKVYAECAEHLTPGKVTR